MYEFFGCFHNFGFVSLVVVSFFQVISVNVIVNKRLGDTLQILCFRQVHLATGASIAEIHKLKKTLKI